MGWKGVCGGLGSPEVALSQPVFLFTSFLSATDVAMLLGWGRLLASSRREPQQELALFPFSVTAAEGCQDPEDVPGWEDRGGPGLTQGNLVMCCFALIHTLILFIFSTSFLAKAEKRFHAHVKPRDDSTLSASVP